MAREGGGEREGEEGKMVSISICHRYEKILTRNPDRP